MAAADRHPDVTSESTPHLLAAVVSDAGALAAGHLGRMQREIADEFQNLKLAMARVAIAIGIVILGAVFVGEALAAILIAIGLAPWASYGIMAVVAMVVGLLALRRLPDDKTDMDLVPEEAIESFRRDVESVRTAMR